VIVDAQEIVEGGNLDQNARAGGHKKILSRWEYLF